MITCYDKEETGKNELDMFGHILKTKPFAYGWIQVSTDVRACVFLPDPNLDKAGSITYRRYTVRARLIDTTDINGATARAVVAVKNGIQGLLNEFYTQKYPSQNEDFQAFGGLGLHLHNMYYNSIELLSAKRLPEPEFDLEVPEIEYME